MRKEAAEKINPVEYWRLRITHKILHRNKLFYTLTPELALATIWAVQRAAKYFSKVGAYYEFGIFKGYNLWLASKLLPNVEVHGFDSFEGMPDEKGAHPHHAPGGYTASVKEVMAHLGEHGADLSRIYLHKGWFSNKFFSSIDCYFPPALIAVIDSDLYSSCIPVLEFLYPRMWVGTILLFDDWKMPQPSEATAFIEFMMKHPSVKAEALFDFGTYGRAIRIKEIDHDTRDEKDRQEGDGRLGAADHKPSPAAVQAGDKRSLSKRL